MILAECKLGYTLHVDGVKEPLPLGTILRLNGIKRASSNGVLSGPSDFVVTTPAREGDKEIQVYPKITWLGKYKTVEKKPKVGTPVRVVRLFAKAWIPSS